MTSAISDTSYLIYRFPLSTRGLELSLNLSREIFPCREEFFLFVKMRVGRGDETGLGRGDLSLIFRTQNDIKGAKEFKPALVCPGKHISVCRQSQI